ncbi:hypothetical protein SDC9_206398 [bioreactor metagenome]|uniref:Uncharacterized protein n=1 Tax=bioreactor metagenome TaxID=1076179 RepID=A0A645J5M1_9ZZZZ
MSHQSQPDLAEHGHLGHHLGGEEAVYVFLIGEDAGDIVEGRHGRALLRHAGAAGVVHGQGGNLVAGQVQDMLEVGYAFLGVAGRVEELFLREVRKGR